MTEAGEWLLVDAKSTFFSNSRLATAYHGKTQRVVVFDGSNGGRTWEWDGSTWVKVATFGPADRLPAMVENEASESCFLLGGRVDQTYVSEPWEWTGSGWKKLPDFGPTPREHHALSYDAGRGRVVLFGGQTLATDAGLTRFGDTWEWDGTGWSPRAGTGPSPRYHHAMTYDRTRNRTVLFGGDKGIFGADGVVHADRLDDTWTWDGVAWTQVADTGPPARSFHQMVFDTVRERVLLFGGAIAEEDGGWFHGADTWEWDGHHWTQVSNSGPKDVFGGANGIMAFDRARGRAVLVHQNKKQTWEWVPDPDGGAAHRPAEAADGPPAG